MFRWTGVLSEPVKVEHTYAEIVAWSIKDNCGSNGKPAQGQAAQTEIKLTFVVIEVNVKKLDLNTALTVVTAFAPDKLPAALLAYAASTNGSVEVQTEFTWTYGPAKDTKCACDVTCQDLVTQAGFLNTQKDLQSYKPPPKPGDKAFNEYRRLAAKHYAMVAVLSRILENNGAPCLQRIAD